MNVQVKIEWIENQNKYTIGLKAFLKAAQLDVPDELIHNTIRKLASKDGLQSE